MTSLAPTIPNATISVEAHAFRNLYYLFLFIYFVQFFRSRRFYRPSLDEALASNGLPRNGLRGHCARGLLRIHIGNHFPSFLFQSPGHGLFDGEKQSGLASDVWTLGCFSPFFPIYNAPGRIGYTPLLRKKLKQLKLGRRYSTPLPAGSSVRRRLLQPRAKPPGFTI